MTFLRSVIRSTMSTEKRLLRLSGSMLVSKEDRTAIREKCSNDIVVPVHWLFEVVSRMIDHQPQEMTAEFQRYAEELS